MGLGARMRYLVSLVEQDASLGVAPSQPGDHLIQPAHEPPVLEMRADVVGGSRGRENEKPPRRERETTGKESNDTVSKNTRTHGQAHRQTPRGRHTQTEKHTIRPRSYTYCSHCFARNAKHGQPWHRSLAPGTNTKAWSAKEKKKTRQGRSASARTGTQTPPRAPPTKKATRRD